VHASVSILPFVAAGQMVLKCIDTETIRKRT
jgi:hypothetical protein